MHDKWKTHYDFIKEKINSMTPAEIAEQIEVPLSNLKLFLLQYRIFPEQKERNLLLELLTLKFKNPAYFSPTKDFYKAVNIRQKRFWQLYRGEHKLTENEYVALVEHFNVSLSDAFEIRQLRLFNDEK